MIVNIRLDLSSEVLAKLGQDFNGRKSNATRKQINQWVEKLVARGIAPDNRPTELRSMVCPKCSRPIAVPVPKAADPAKSAEKPKESQRAANAIDDVIAALAKFKESLQ